LGSVGKRRDGNDKGYRGGAAKAGEVDYGSWFHGMWILFKGRIRRDYRQNRDWENEPTTLVPTGTGLSFWASNNRSHRL
jgi:hypothetical protein